MPFLHRVDEHRLKSLPQNLRKVWERLRLHFAASAFRREGLADHGESHPGSSHFPPHPCDIWHFGARNRVVHAYRHRVTKMHLLKRLVVLGMLALTACAATDRRSSTIQSRFSTKPCAPDLTAAAAICGSIAVPENWAMPRGRMIDLNVIVFPAARPVRVKVAQFDLEGGPGFGVTESAGFYATDGAAFHEHRDVVLVDMRGTGFSNPLRCEGIESYERTQPAAPMYPADLVAACARQLASRADVRQYGTAAASRDLDAVRNALGYAQIDLYAISYGTTLALRFIADYPSHVRSAVLTGTVPADQTPPAHHSRSADRALQRLFDACAADRACAEAYPDPRAELDVAVQRTGAKRRDQFMERVRTMMYTADSARGLPAFFAVSLAAMIRG